MSAPRSWLPPRLRRDLEAGLPPGLTVYVLPGLRLLAWRSGALAARIELLALPELGPEAEPGARRRLSAWNRAVLDAILGRGWSPSVAVGAHRRRDPESARLHAGAVRALAARPPSAWAALRRLRGDLSAPPGARAPSRGAPRHPAEGAAPTVVPARQGGSGTVRPVTARPET